MIVLLKPVDLSFVLFELPGIGERRCGTAFDTTGAIRFVFVLLTPATVSMETCAGEWVGAT